MILITHEKLESYPWSHKGENQCVTKLSICGLVLLHNYNINKCFCNYLDLAFHLLGGIKNLSHGLHKVFRFMKANTMYEHEYYAKARCEGEAASLCEDKLTKC